MGGNQRTRGGHGNPPRKGLRSGVKHATTVLPANWFIMQWGWPLKAKTFFRFVYNYLIYRPLILSCSQDIPGGFSLFLPVTMSSPMTIVFIWKLFQNKPQPCWGVATACKLIWKALQKFDTRCPSWCNLGLDLQPTRPRRLPPSYRSPNSPFQIDLQYFQIPSIRNVQQFISFALRVRIRQQRACHILFDFLQALIAWITGLRWEKG